MKAISNLRRIMRGRARTVGISLVLGGAVLGAGGQVSANGGSDANIVVECTDGVAYITNQGGSDAYLEGAEPGGDPFLGTGDTIAFPGEEDIVLMTEEGDYYATAVWKDCKCEPTTTEAPTTTAGPTTTAAPTTTAGPTTTAAPTTTAGPTTTEAPTTTAGPTTTEAPTTTAGPTTTAAPTTTLAPALPSTGGGSTNIAILATFCILAGLGLLTVRRPA